MKSFLIRISLAGFAAMVSLEAGAADVAPPADPVMIAISRLQDSNPSVRRQAAGDLGMRRDPRAIPGLIEKLGDENGYVRAAAEDSLGLLRAVQAAPKIADLLLRDPEAQVRKTAAVTLVYLAQPSTEDALIQALKDPQEGVRFAVVRTLGAMRSFKSIAVLVSVLKDPNPEMRRTVAETFGLIGSTAPVSELRGAVKDANSGVRSAAAQALGAIGDNSAAQDIRGLLKDGDMGVRVQAAMALGRLGDFSGVAVGLELLKDKNPSFRSQGGAVLAAVGDKETAWPALTAACKAEKDPAVKQMLDFSRGQLKARLGIKEEVVKPAEPPVKSTTTAANLSPKLKKSKIPGAPGKKKVAIPVQGVPTR